MHSYEVKPLNYSNIERNALISQLYKGIQTPLAIITPGGEVQFSTPTLLRVLGKDNITSLLKEVSWESADDLRTAIHEALYHGSWQGVLVLLTEHKKKSIDVSLNIVEFGSQRLLQFNIAHTEVETLAEKQRKVHEKEMRILFESMPWGVAVSDMDRPTLFRYVNRAFCTLTGYSKNDMLLNPNLVTSLYGTCTEENQFPFRLKEHFSFEKNLLHDVPIQNAAKQIIFCDIHSSFILIDGKKYLANYFQVVDDRHKAVSKLSEFNNEMMLTQSLTASGTWRWNLNTSKVEWSEGLYELLDKKPEECQPANKIFFDGIVEEQREEVLAIIEYSIDDVKPFEVDFQLMYADGSRTLVRMVGVVEVNEGGHRVLTAALQNVNKSLEVEAALRKSENTRRKTAAISHTGFWEMELPTKQIDWSEEVFRLCGIENTIEERSQPFSRKDFHNLIHPRERQRIIERFNQLSQIENRFNLQYRIVLPNNTLKYLLEKVEVTKDSAGQATLLSGTIQDITQHKNIENELKYQRYLLQNVNDAIISTNNRLEIKSWNKAAAEIYGWTENEVLGKKLNDLIDLPKETFSTTDKVLKSVMNTGFWKGNIIQKTKKGEKVVIQSSARLLRDQNNFPLGIAVVNRDITAFTKVEEQARKSETILELIFDSIPGWIFWQDKNLLVQGCNRNFIKAIGKKSRKEVIGKPMHDLIADTAFVTQATKASKEILASGKEQFHTVEHYQSESSRQWLDVNRIPLLSAKKKVIGVMCTLEDITEKKEIEAKLKANQANLASVIENTDDLIWYVDKKHRFQAFNSAVSQTVKSVLEKDIKPNDNFFGVLPNEYRKLFRDFHEEVMEGKKLSKEIKFDQRIGLPQWYEFSGNPIFNGEQISGACYIARDITLRKEQEQELVEGKINKEKELSLAVIQGQEEERKRVSMELHDGVCQTLTALQMQINYLEDEGGAKLEKLSQPLTRIIELAEHAEMEVRRISSNLMPSVLTDFGLPEAVEHLCNIIFQGEHVVFDNDLILNGKRFENAVEVGVFRIVQEALNNIYKHSGASEVSITLLDEENRIFLSIKDNGRGFSQEEAKERRKKRNGLNNLAQRVSLLNGTIEIESVPGNGCEIIAYIPYKKSNR